MTVLSLTDKAAEHAHRLMEQADGAVLGLRVGIATKGCSGMSYKIEYAEERKPYEEVFEDRGVTIFVDPAAMMFLIGAVMDYEEAQFSSGFVFHNPNEKSRCGCGESFSV